MCILKVHTPSEQCDEVFAAQNATIEFILGVVVVATPLIAQLEVYYIRYDPHRAFIQLKQYFRQSMFIRP